MSERWGKNVAEKLAFAILLSAIIVPRLMMSVCVTEFGADGSFYTDIARNVRDGHGLSTNVSVFHHAFQYFPHKTSTYPLWPLLYGFFAKLSPLETVAVWLPTLFYVVAVLLAYALGQRLVPSSLSSRISFHGGHLFAILLALNVQFIVATSRPYTEGLAFVLLFSLLLRANILWRSLSFLHGAELGFWLVALFLTRSQFIVVSFAAAATVPIVLMRRPQQAALFSLGAILSFSLVWRLYAGWLETFLPEPTIGTYLRLDLARVGDQLSVVPFLVDPGSLFGRMLDLVRSLGWAFSLNAYFSYHSLYHGSAYAMPVAVVVLVTRWRKIPVVWRFMRRTSSLGTVFFYLTALALTASLHTIHHSYGPTWLFGSRLAIPSVLLVFTALLYLLRSRLWFIRASGFFFLSAGLYGSWTELVLMASDDCEHYIEGRTLDSYRPGLVRWLQAERESLGALTVAVERPEAQHLSWRTQGIGYHWLSESTTVDDLVVMVTELDVRYIVLFIEVNNVKFVRDIDFDAKFVQLSFDEQTDLGRARVFAPRCGAFDGLETCVD